MPTPSELAQAQLDAYNNRDIDAFMACYSDDCVVRAFPSGEVLMRGHEAMRARYSELFASCPELHAKLVARMVRGRVVIDEEDVTGHSAGERVHAIAMYAIRDDKIAEVHFARD